MQHTETARESGVEGDRRPDWRRALPTIVAVFVVTRLLVLLIAATVEFALPLTHVGPTRDERPILSSLTGSDSLYYLGIAEEGYHLEPVRENYRDWVFFPLYPLIVKAVSFLTLGDIALAGVLVANLAALAAMVLLYRLSVTHLGHQTGLQSVVYLAIAPGAVALAMAYSESLFLLLAVGTFLAAERRQWGLTALLYALAALTRLPGVLLAIPLFVLMIQTLGKRPNLAWLSLLAGPIALASFYAYLGAFTGDPLANLRAQAAWNIAPVVENGQVSVAAFHPLPLMLIATLLLYVFLFVYVRVDRLPLAYVAMAIVAVVTVVAGGRLQSVARYLAVAWPFSWILAGRRSSWVPTAWPIVSAGLFALHAALHFAQALAP